jgi:hypothetical protein
MTAPGKQIELLDKAIRQTRWAMANTSIALWCAILAFFVFLAGYMMAGVLIIACWHISTVTTRTVSRAGGRKRVGDYANP